MPPEPQHPQPAGEVLLDEQVAADQVPGQHEEEVHRLDQRAGSLAEAHEGPRVDGDHGQGGEGPDAVEAPDPGRGRTINHLEIMDDYFVCLGPAQARRPMVRAGLITSAKKSLPLSSTTMNAGKSRDLDPPDRFHAELGVLEHLDLGDAVLGQPGRRRRRSSRGRTRRAAGRPRSPRPIGCPWPA